MSDEAGMIGVIFLLVVGMTVFNFIDLILTAIKWIFILALFGVGSTLLYLHYVSDIDMEELL